MQQHAVYLKMFVALVLIPAPASAATFTIDSSQSWLEVYLSFDLPDGTRVIEPQSPGSLLTAVQGTIDIDQTLPGHFAATAEFQLVEQPGSFQPLGLPANWAGYIADLDGPGNDLLLAARNVGSTAFSLDWIPLAVDGSFDPQQVVAIFEFGTLDLQFPGEEVASLPMGFLNLAAANQSTDAGRLHYITPNTLEFRLPVYSRYSNPVLNGLVTGLEGEIVAYLLVPEPSGLLTAAVGLAVVSLSGRRIRRRYAGVSTTSI